MKIIFSRKGVDSASGKCASAVVNGGPISLPIPVTNHEAPTPTRYGDLADPRSALARDLSKGLLAFDKPCHLDPDIDCRALRTERPAGWRGALGQAGSALSHLLKMGVGQGDVFLFWGVFRECKRDSSGWSYFGPRFHAIFGWLEIETVVHLGPDGTHALRRYPWLAQHPHVTPGWTDKNALFIAREALSIDQGICGFGVFDHPIRMTKIGAKPSTWIVPKWLDQANGGVGMTFNPADRWQGDGLVTVPGRGQEFVADAGHRSDARDWLLSLFGGVTCKSGPT